MTRKVNYTATDGKIYSREFTGWTEHQLSFVRFLRHSYKCEGYVCDDDEETWITGWERKHVFKKAGHPDKIIEYMRVEMSQTTAIN